MRCRLPASSCSMRRSGERLAETPPIWRTRQLNHYRQQTPRFCRSRFKYSATVASLGGYSLLLWLHPFFSSRVSSPVWLDPNDFAQR